MKNLKGLLKNPFFYLASAIFLALVIFSVMFFFQLKNVLDRFTIMKKDLASVSAIADHIKETIDSSFDDIGSAELLLENANQILSTVYLGKADLDLLKDAKNFTAFSLFYDDSFYIITAGHCVELDGNRYFNFRFKANDSDSWLRPELLYYENDHENSQDFAIFYLGKPVNTGLIPAGPTEDMAPRYILGNLDRGLNLVKKYSSAVEGESGSPVLNSSCHVIGVLIKSDGTYTPIQTVLDEIKRLSRE